MRIKLDKDPLAIEQSNYASKILNIYSAYDLDAGPKVRLRNFVIKPCLFGATSIVKNSDKEKWVYSAYGIAFDGKVEWSFVNDYARNVTIFGVESSPSSHADNLKNNILVLGE